jgi:3-hydroxyacyl-CoA dehydrogenase/enoyl-CoA hydratase/3-hydroxybutyryl-CoA epimerase
MAKFMKLKLDDDGIAHLVLDNPDERVNVLSEMFVKEFLDQLDHIEKDGRIKALILESAKPGVFFAGADIKWLKTFKTAEQCRAFSVYAHVPFNRLENLKMHTVAAINGVCLGGGLELAMACRWRVAMEHKSVQIGLPEVKLGVLPGGGGTQRLTALVGIQSALQLACAGKTVRADDALKLGVIDAVLPSQGFAEAAKRFLLEKIKAGADYGRPWHEPDYRYGANAEEKNPEIRKKIFETSRQLTLKQTKGHVRSPMKIIDAVEAGAEKGFRAGLQAEQAAFAEVLCSPEARGLVDLFLMQNAMTKVYGSEDRTINPVDVKKVGILGAGLMGSGIAHSFIAAGKKTVMKDISEEALSRGAQSIQGIFNQDVKKGKMSEAKANEILSLLQTTLDYEAFRDVDMVVEAVFEDLNLKHKTIRDIEKVIPKHCIVASNTSSLAITELAKASERPDKFIGMHYFSPVNRMPLLEIIKGEKTSEQTVVTAVAMAHATRKLPIVVNDGYGFYTTRAVAAYLIEALRCLNDGADIGVIDSVMMDYGFPVGPITLLDEVGHDVGAHVLTIMRQAFPDRFSDELTKATVADGRLGRKNGRGFYVYEGGKKKGIDETAYSLFKSRSDKKLSQGDIQERVVMNLLNEVGFCLGENIVTNAVDAEMGLVFGIGFPPFRGGPLHAMDEMGADNVIAALSRLETKWGSRFKSAPYLLQAARDKKVFCS